MFGLAYRMRNTGLAPEHDVKGKAAARGRMPFRDSPPGPWPPLGEVALEQQALAFKKATQGRLGAGEGPGGHVSGKGAEANVKLEISK